jgi:hypothetical protein
VAVADHSRKKNLQKKSAAEIIQVWIYNNKKYTTRSSTRGGRKKNPSKN